MRKPRDYDAELKALDERARGLRTRKLQQLGELVIGTGADALPAEVLAGALLAAVETKDDAAREGWRARGAALFQKAGRRQESPGEQPGGAPPAGSGTLPFAGGTGAQ
jgi:DNA-binding protein H-NS